MKTWGCDLFPKTKMHNNISIAQFRRLPGEGQGATTDVSASCINLVSWLLQDGRLVENQSEDLNKGNDL